MSTLGKHYNRGRRKRSPADMQFEWLSQAWQIRDALPQDALIHERPKSTMFGTYGFTNNYEDRRRVNIGDLECGLLVKTFQLRYPTPPQRPKPAVENMDLKVELDQLPIELLDIILQNCFMSSTLQNIPKVRTQDLFENLASVNTLWLRRITRRPFKTGLSKRVAGFYIYQRIIRNNSEFLSECIHCSDELIDRLNSLDCLSIEQADSIKKLHRNKHKNIDLLHTLRPFQADKCYKFIRCLCETNKILAASVVCKGGIVVKAVTQNESVVREFVNSLDQFCLKGKKHNTKAAALISNEEIGYHEPPHRQSKRKVVWIWLQTNFAYRTLEMLTNSSIEDKHIDGQYLEFSLPESVFIAHDDFQRDFIQHCDIVGRFHLHRDFLERIISFDLLHQESLGMSDPNSSPSLLENLQLRGALNATEVLSIKQKIRYQKTSQLLDYIFAKNEVNSLVNALQDTFQSDVVKYVIYDQPM